MSFHEKSAWACLVAILLVFVPFFVVIFSNSGYPVVIPAFIGTVVVLVLILTVVYTVFALSSAKIRRSGDVPPRDERELAIELRSTKIASFVLAFAVMTWCLAAYVGIPLLRIRQHQAMEDASLRIDQALANPDVATLSLSNLMPIPAHDALLWVHVLFACFVLANVIYYAALVVGYRRSA